MEDLLFDSFIREKTMHATTTPTNTGLWDSIAMQINNPETIELNNDAYFDTVIKNKTYNLQQASVPSQLWDKIQSNIQPTTIENYQFDTQIKDKIYDYASEVPENTWNSINQNLIPITQNAVFDAQIKNKLYNTESKVLPHIWENIYNQLHKTKQPKGVWLFSKRTAAVALTIGLLTSAALLLKNKFKPVITTANNNKIVNSIASLQNKNNNNSQPLINASTETIELDNKINNNTKDITQNRVSYTTSQKPNNFYTNTIGLNTQELDNTTNNNNNPALSIDNLASNGNEFTQTFNGNTFATPITEVASATVANNELLEKNNNLLSHLKATKLSASKMLKPCYTSIYSDNEPTVNIEFFSGIEYLTKNTNNLTANPEYLAKKDSAERMVGGYNFGVRASVNLNNGLFLKTGFQYNQALEKFTQSYKEIREITDKITKIIPRIGLPDTTIVIVSTSLQEQSILNTTYNKYKSIEIPFLLSYENASQQNNWRVGVTIGPLLNIKTWYSGQTINSNNQIVPLQQQNLKPSFYTHKLSFNLYASASVIKKLSPSIDVFAEPYLKYNLSDANVGNGFSQQFNAIGINIGAKYSFLKNKF